MPLLHIKLLSMSAFIPFHHHQQHSQPTTTTTTTHFNLLQPINNLFKIMSSELQHQNQAHAGTCIGHCRAQRFALDYAPHCDLIRPTPYYCTEQYEKDKAALTSYEEGWVQTFNSEAQAKLEDDYEGCCNTPPEQANILGTLSHETESRNYSWWYNSDFVSHRERDVKNATRTQCLRLQGSFTLAFDIEFSVSNVWWPCQLVAKEHSASLLFAKSAAFGVLFTVTNDWKAKSRASCYFPKPCDNGSSRVGVSEGCQQETKMKLSQLRGETSA